MDVVVYRASRGCAYKCSDISETLTHVAKTVAGVNLSKHVVDVVFILFDEDGQS